MDDLAAYGGLAAQLPLIGPDDELVIAAGDFPEPLADHMAFNGLLIDTAFTRSVTWGGDDLPFEFFDSTPGFDGYAMPDGYRRIGLWLLHLLFSGRDWAGLHLTHPTSRARSFYVQIQRPMPSIHGLQADAPLRYSRYIYRPQQVWRHPFAGVEMTPVQRIEQAEDRPLFAFGWSSGQHTDLGHARKADQLILQATPDGIAAIAALMFDMGHPTLGRDEVNMEPPYVGYAGTQPRSIEARFWLPGSFVFYADDLDGISFPPFR